MYAEREQWTLNEHLYGVVLHEIRQTPQELRGIRPVNMAMIACDGHRHLLHSANADQLFARVPHERNMREA